MRSPEITLFLEWLEIRERYGQDVGGALQLRADADHSALLRRLMSGKQPFPEPPPRAMSYPWYELLENGRAEAFEVYLYPYDNAVFPKGSLVVEQTPWTVIETLGEDSWIATYKVPDVEAIAALRRTPEWRKGGPLPHKLSDSRWKVYSPGPHPQVPERKRWILERI